MGLVEIADSDSSDSTTSDSSSGDSESTEFDIIQPVILNRANVVVTVTSGANSNSNDLPITINKSSSGKGGKGKGATSTVTIPQVTVNLPIIKTPILTVSKPGKGKGGPTPILPNVSVNRPVVTINNNSGKGGKGSSSTVGRFVSRPRGR